MPAQAPIMAAPISPARRALLRGRTATAPARSPYAIDEDRFTSLCTRCDACAEACPEQVLMRGDGGFPEMRFGSGECTFCGECADACPAPALQLLDHRPWQWQAKIEPGCLMPQGVMCRSCGDACQTQALRFDPRRPNAEPTIDADCCSGCGACVGTCPTGAIRMHEATDA